MESKQGTLISKQSNNRNELMVLGVSVGSMPCKTKGNNSPITEGIWRLRAGTTDENTRSKDTCRADWAGSFRRSVDCITMD